MDQLDQMDAFVKAKWETPNDPRVIERKIRELRFIKGKRGGFVAPMGPLTVVADEIPEEYPLRGRYVFSKNQKHLFFVSSSGRNKLIFEYSKSQNRIDSHEVIAAQEAQLHKCKVFVSKSHVLYVK